MLHHYTVYLFPFAAQNSACNRRHQVPQRLARWLLILHDRVGHDEFDLTHDFISQMLGVRRATVTEAPQEFEGRGWICATRGRMTIVDRAAREAADCGCYRVVRRALESHTVGDGADSPAGRALARGGKSVIGDQDGATE
jgi:hypothetical protein